MELYIGNYWITVPNKETERLVRNKNKQECKPSNHSDSEPMLLFLPVIIGLVAIVFAFAFKLIVGILVVALIAGLICWGVIVTNKQERDEQEFKRLLAERHIVHAQPTHDERSSQLKDALGDSYYAILRRGSQDLERSTIISDYLSGDGVADDEVVKAVAAKLLCLHKL